MKKFSISHARELKGDVDSLKSSIMSHLHYTIGKDEYTATKRDIFYSICYTIKDQLIEKWIKTQQNYYDQDLKRVYYLSMEFLIGRLLKNSLINLGLYENCEKAVHDLGFDLEELVDIEMDAGLGNGGLGRLAACFLDSMATLGIPGYGYGIRYEYGIFTQRIENGEQVETPDNWLRYGNPWEMCRSEYLYPTHFYGRVVEYTDAHGHTRHNWVETQEVMAMAYDIPVAGYDNETVNSLRLWQAKSTRGFDFSYFNHGDYIRAIEEASLTENISRVLYPNDNFFLGQELRLKQEYFLVSATLQDILRRYSKGHTQLDALPTKVAIQLNDTHPALAIAEMMHILVDKEELTWERAWELTREVFAYTNHTLLPEALERWPIPILEKVLPRHMQIIYEINRRWLETVEKHFPNNLEAKQKLSIIEEGEPKRVNMARLAIVGSHKVNGVSALHTKLLEQEMFKEFYDMDPTKFTNKTNGVTPRRWIKECNPLLSDLITSKIGPHWLHELTDLEKLLPFANDPGFQEEIRRVKRANKENLAKVIFAEHDQEVNLDSMFDCQVKRIHEYKRQLLNAMHVIHLYMSMKDNPNKDWTPRTVIFSGKAAPGYSMAKSIIRLINSIAHVVNHDPETNQYLKLFFLSNYRVSLAESIIPACDLSEQISTAGTEASGTGNMKFALNGALTIGTLDGANVEILEEVGPENIFIFGLKTPEVHKLKEERYNPRAYYERNPHLKRVIDLISEGYFCDGDCSVFQQIVHSLLDGGDKYCLLADFASYIEAQERVSELYKDQKSWTNKAVHNIALNGKFSSDRTIREYARDIWKVREN
jgi:glycogen phosphorylase